MTFLSGRSLGLIVRLTLALSQAGGWMLGVPLAGQATAATPQPTAAVDAANAGTSTDLFVGIGTDVDRPGLSLRANLSIGFGHTFAFLTKDPLGDEATFAYTYENAGAHGFFHTPMGEHTESAGIMKNFALPRTKTISGYTWLQSGITTYTNYSVVRNRLDSSASLGAIVHISNHNSIWLQEAYNKAVTVPWYTTSSVSYTLSW